MPETSVSPPPWRAARAVLVAAPLVILGCAALGLGRYAACHRDPSSYGNAWTADEHGYCAHSGWPALTGGVGHAVLAVVLLAVTVLWPAIVVCAGAAIAAARRDARLKGVVWRVAWFGSLLVVAFYIVWGHVAIVGGGGG